MKQTIIKKVLSLCKKCPAIIIIKRYDYLGWHVDEEFKANELHTMFSWDDSMYTITAEFIRTDRLVVTCRPTDPHFNGITSDNLILDLSQEESLEIKHELFKCSKLYTDNIREIFN